MQTLRLLPPVARVLGLSPSRTPRWPHAEQGGAPTSQLPAAKGTSGRHRVICPALRKLSALHCLLTPLPFSHYLQVLLS